MIEETPASADDELQTVTRGVTRSHLVVLCCAHSVAELVDEVARNLRGLGFAVEVVCGAEARTALLSRGTGGDEPTIYVVCVQGTLKEQVLKPLRQALATHGGPNQHLFVAVLDLSLPLAMVGQIRRFAEALERPRRRADGLGERRQWREQLGPNTERVATRSYRALEVVSRTDTLPPSGIDVVRRTGPQAVIGSGRIAKIGATDKYRAVTGALPTADGAAEAAAAEEAASRRRRRAHAPKVKVKPVAASRPHARAAAATAAAATSSATTATTTPAITGDTVVTGAPVATSAANTPSVPMVANATATPVVAPTLGVEAPTTGLRRRGRTTALAGVAVLGAAGLALWLTGGATRLAAMVRGDARPTAVASAGAQPAASAPSDAGDSTPPRDTTPSVASLAATPSERAATSDPTLAAVEAKAEPAVAEAAVEPTPNVAAAPDVAAAPNVESAAPNVESTAAPTPAAEPTPAAAPTPAIEPTPASAVTPAPSAASPASTALAAAVDARRLRVTDTLYVTGPRGSGGSWQSARAICDAFEIDGVGGFRLPHRRELQALDVLGLLRDEPHWSRTVPDDDSESAYVLHPSTGQLTVWFKEETAATVCVRPR